MAEYYARENAYFDLRDCDRDAMDDLLEIGKQVKEKLGLMVPPIQAVSENRVYVGSIIGNIRLNQTRLVILPKVPGGEAAPNAVLRAFYARSVKCSMGNLNKTLYFTKHSIVSTDDLFVDVLSSIFAASLRAALRGSRMMQYEEKSGKCSVVKGRVLMGKQLSQPPLDAKTWCRYHVMSDDHIYHQLLYWACRYLSESVHDFEEKRRLLLLSREFSGKTDLLSVYAVKQLRLPRQFAEYRDALTIAQNLYLGTGGKKESGTAGRQICGYVINMERAFEQIVCHFSRAAAQQLGLSHKSQATLSFAAAKDGGDGYDVRPDDLISGGGKHLVMDAKYKVLSAEDAYRKKPSREDFYQMVSTCIACQSSEAILVYPAGAAFPNRAWETIRAVNGEKIRISALGIDILEDEDAIMEAMKGALQNSCLYKEKTL